ncbi:MAG: hypothetical protein GX117_04970 [Candidatus Hydrogenedentes bacterium]|nr:hypothetical protein [Candidatus Hydrogenedentota bacterium]
MEVKQAALRIQATLRSGQRLVGRLLRWFLVLQCPLTILAVFGDPLRLISESFPALYETRVFSMLFSLFPAIPLIILALFITQFSTIIGLFLTIEDRTHNAAPR